MSDWAQAWGVRIGMSLLVALYVALPAQLGRMWGHHEQQQVDRAIYDPFGDSIASRLDLCIAKQECHVGGVAFRGWPVYASDECARRVEETFWSCQRDERCERVFNDAGWTVKACRYERPVRR